MSIVMTIKKGNATINIHDDCIPKDIVKYKENLTRLYDRMNIIARDLSKENIDVSDLFYTQEELENLPKEVFI